MRLGLLVHTQEGETITDRKKTVFFLQGIHFYLCLDTDDGL